MSFVYLSSAAVQSYAIGHDAVTMLPRATCLARLTPRKLAFCRDAHTQHRISLACASLATRASGFLSLFVNESGEMPHICPCRELCCTCSLRVFQCCKSSCSCDAGPRLQLLVHNQAFFSTVVVFQCCRLLCDMLRC
jgi:hypothetical protein